MFRPVYWLISVGNVAIIARNSAPTIEILPITFARYSIVALPGLMPGMKPPFDFMFCATSIGLKLIVV